MPTEYIRYEAELDTVTGTLTGVRIDYSHPKNQRRTRLELPELRFENSRLDSASRQRRVAVQIEGPGEDRRSDETPRPDTARTRHGFTTDGLDGEIVGKQADSIVLGGAGPKGGFAVELKRKDRARTDQVIDFPMQ